jgi:hypothetical protein
MISHTISFIAIGLIIAVVADTPNEVSVDQIQGEFKDNTHIIEHDKEDHGWNLDFKGAPACEVPDSVCNILIIHTYP